MAAAPFTVKPCETMFASPGLPAKVTGSEPRQNGPDRSEMNDGFGYEQELLIESEVPAALDTVME